MIVPISGGVWVSSFPCLRDVPQLQGVRGIASVINAPTPDEVVSSLGAQTFHYPLSDGKYPGVDDLLAAATGFAELPRPAVVHCRAGRNRSMAVALLVAGLENGWTGDHAIAFGELVRPRALANHAYRDLLRELLG